MTKPLVTIVNAPRERFTLTSEALESIYANTEVPFNLVYVDGNSPPKVKQYLEEQSKEKGFKLIRKDYYLYPNVARNLGLREVDTPYVVFIDNDVLVTPGWLKSLIQCAEETGAAVVGPLTGIGPLKDNKIHYAGGEVHIVEQEKDSQVKRRVHEKMHFHNRPLAKTRDQIQRAQCELAEFHCMLVCTEIFEKTGMLDEKLLNTREHLDFCMLVAQAGGTVYCEPTSYVTYVPDLKYIWSDMHFYMLRWSNAWELSSLKHFSEKWDVGTKDAFFQERYKNLGWRREKGFVRPTAERIAPGKNSVWVSKIIRRVDRWLNPILTDLYAQQETKRQKQNSSTTVSVSREPVAAQSK
ncbi:glycosyltransferase family 2 protein [Lusitaniella coriacea]|uniref:glycosyltransferase family 2 protein n=1 Tax=Lusitaniella coriacea TaxID=1983105 RepID=UPI003CF12C46